jgi:1-phosphofructokinase
MIITVTPNPAVDVTLAVAGFRPGGVCAARRVDEQAAGKGVNVSLCLSTLGVPSKAVCLIGEIDRALYRRALYGSRAEGVFVTGAFRTRRNLTLLDPASGEDTHLREEGPEVSDDLVAALGAAVRAAVAPGDVVVFSGSLPPGFAPDRLAGMLREAGAAEGVPVIDADEPPLGAALPHARMAKPNLVELAGVTGRKEAWAEALLAAPQAKLVREVAAAAAALGPPSVCVTCGKRGAFLFTEAGRWYAPAQAAGRRVRNRRGAGDAFLAGFLAAQAEGAAPPDCLRRGVACGTASCFSTGTAGLDPADVRALERAAPPVLTL